MSPNELVRTLYLGDRSVKRVCIDSWSNSVRIQIDEISRIRSPDGIWNFYSDENIKDAEIVLTDVESVRLEPSGPLPNDSIESVSVEPGAEGTFEFMMRVVSANVDLPTTVVTIYVRAKDIYLFDPTRPNLRIRD